MRSQPSASRDPRDGRAGTMISPTSVDVPGDHAGRSGGPFRGLSMRTRVQNSGGPPVVTCEQASVRP